MNACPSRVTLEQFLLTPEKRPERSHIESCPSCQERLAEMHRLGEEFNHHVYPATVAQVVKARAAPAKKPWSLGRLWQLPAFALSLACAVWVLRPAVTLREAPSDYVGAKGESFELQIFVEETNGSTRIREGASVRPHTRWRSAVRSATPCSLWILTVDATGSISRIVPPEGEHGAALTVSGEVAGGAQLDERTGPERVIAICGAKDLGWAELRDSAQRTYAPAGVEKVRAIRELGGLPKGTQQASVLLEKAP